MKHNGVAVCTLILVGSLLSTVRAQTPTADPRAGIWKINLQKSKYSPGPPPQSSVWRFESRPDGYTVITITGANSQGQPTFTHVVLKYDGKDYPLYSQASVTALQAAGTKLGTMSHKLSDPYTLIASPKDGSGVAGLPITVTVSKDGKTLTQTVKGKNAQGQTIENIAVYDRVQ